MQNSTILNQETCSFKELTLFFGVSPNTLKARIKQKLPFYAAKWYATKKMIYWRDEIKLIVDELSSNNVKQMQLFDEAKKY